ncbi:MAG: MerC domain-containing protein [Verrucomicrobiota bacterium]
MIMQQANTQTHQLGWLDKIAVSMALLCAIHCLVTPLLLVLLPIISTTFFVHEDFHLWMLLLVLPTTTFAIFMGCRKHKDRWVASFSAVGLSILLLAVVQEQRNAALHAAESESVPHCENCARDLAKEPIPMNASAWFNVLGGVFLASAHVRNYRLCQKKRCANGCLCED